MVAVATDRRGIIYQGVSGLADRALATPMAADAIFRIASMTSCHLGGDDAAGRTGAGDADDPADNPAELSQLTVFQSFDSATGAYAVRPVARRLTIRQLMTHIPGSVIHSRARWFGTSNRERANAMRPVLFCLNLASNGFTAPGTHWVGRVVEAISGQDSDQVLS